VPISGVKTVTTLLILLLAGLGALASGLAVLGIEARRAPLGYEDDAGYHDGDDVEFSPEI